MFSDYEEEFPALNMKARIQTKKRPDLHHEFFS
jgi:hypothetical protein